MLALIGFALMIVLMFVLIKENFDRGSCIFTDL